MLSRLMALTLAALAPAGAFAQVTITVNAAADRHAINPLVYGVHFADTDTLLDLNATINRYGGNSSGRYNWLDNIDNRGSDYYFYSFPYFPRTPGAWMDDFVQTTKDGGAEAFLTMPMVGSVAKSNGNDPLWSFSVAACGAQTDSDGDAGNGCVAGGGIFPCAPGSPMLAPYAPGCDPANAASIPADHVFQQGFAQHVKDTFGAASAGGLKFWGTDNEPTIWHTAYWDVHPVGATAAEVRDKMFAYGDMIKGVDPGVQILGPEEWGWDGFFYSGRDQQLWSQGLCGGFDCPDHVAHGDYAPYLLSQMSQHEVNTGIRVLDWFSLHFYPQGGEFSSDVTPAMQLLRNRSTRALWDPAYVDEAWIGQPVKLIPRMKDWVSTSYPGLKLGLTEYNWGAESHINGATAQADLLGIFGRENLDMAIRWVVPVAGTPVYNAFKMYRNYDGLQSTFGDTSVSATGPDPDVVAAFAAQRSTDNALTIMAVSKALSGSTSATFNLAGYPASGSVEEWQLTSANVITRVMPDLSYAGGTFSRTLSPQSITLFVVHGTVVPPPPLSYFTLAPCRVVDTRGGAPVGGPALEGQQTRTFAVAGNCAIPATAKALSINLAVTQPTAAGNVRLFPAGQAVPTVSSINYVAGQTRGNNAVIPLDAGGAMAAFVGQAAGTTVHLIIDVNGYFE